MKMTYNVQDESLALALKDKMLKSLDNGYLASVFMEECGFLYLDYNTEADNFMNIQMEIERIGFKEVAKAIFVDSHPYRSDCGKCPRCYRFRPEITWNNENLAEPYVCNRCSEIIKDST